MPYLVLAIDDEQDVLTTLKLDIEEQLEDTACVTHDTFATARDRIAEEEPDAIVLDLREGENHTAGEPAWEYVWNAHFCPLIIYTAAGIDLDPPVPENHPFVKVCPKGSTVPVIEGLRSFIPYINALRDVKSVIADILNGVLRFTVPEQLDDPSQLVHRAQRQLAAAMDDTTMQGRQLAAWEKYLVPPVGKSPLTADVIRRSDTDPADPAAYRVILTPSCDLQAGRAVDRVLTARCAEEVQFIRQGMGVDANTSKAKVKDKLPKALTQACQSGCVPLPACPGIFPALTVLLKEQELIPYAAIENGKEFQRIASIDSPFREQLVWAWIQTTGRPGVPPRDLGPWVQGLLDAHKPD